MTSRTTGKRTLRSSVAKSLPHDTQTQLRLLQKAVDTARKRSCKVAATCTERRAENVKCPEHSPAPPIIAKATLSGSKVMMPEIGDMLANVALEDNHKFNFHQIDALRTLQFLIQGLRTQIASFHLDDLTVQCTMATIMSTAKQITQLPPPPPGLLHSANQTWNTETPACNSKSCQTLRVDDATTAPVDYSAIEPLQINMHQLNSKFNDNCDTLKTLCDTVLEDRQIQNDYVKSQESVAQLKIDINVLETKLMVMVDAGRNATATFQNKIAQLEFDLKTVRDSSSNEKARNTSIIDDLNQRIRNSVNKIRTLEEYKINQEQQNVMSEFKLGTLTMLLELSDSQMNAIRKEFHTIQRLAKSQFEMLQQSSAPDTMAMSSIVDPRSSDSSRHSMANGQNDSNTTIDATNSIYIHYNRDDKHNDTFSQCAVAPPPHPFDEEMSVLFSTPSSKFNLSASSSSDSEAHQSNSG